MKSLLRSLVILLVVVELAHARLIHVPEDKLTIQAGIEAASNGDTVLVQPGVYKENINYNGKNIVVGSLFVTTQDTAYISQTVIDGNESGSVVTFEHGEDSTAALSGFTITNGLAHNGGGIHCFDYSGPSLKYMIISRNRGEGGGGLACAFGASPRLEYVTLSGNNASSGGGIYCWDQSSPRLEHVTIYKNRAEEGGGGIHCARKSSPRLKHVTISENSTFEGTGGMLCTYGSSPSLEHVTISGNSVERGGAGGLSFHLSTPSLKHVVITGNSAVSSGGMLPLPGIGGLSCTESSPRLEHVLISENSAVIGVWGGGLAYGGMYCSDSTPTLNHVTITENEYRGGLYCANSHPKLVNTILWNNESVRDDPGGVQVHLYDGSSLSIAYSDVKQGRSGIGTYEASTLHWLEGNIEEDPRFVDAESGDFRLQEPSPCRDAGTAFFEVDGDTLIDVRSDEFVGSAPDLGAFEFGLVVGIEEASSTLPTRVQLMQNYPNPFNPGTTIAYDLPRASYVALSIYTLTGQKIAVLVDAHQEAGHHTVLFDGSPLGTGVYLSRLQVEGFMETRRMVLLK